MMNFKSISSFRLSDATVLTRHIITGAGDSPIANPVFPIIREISTFPRGAFFTSPVFAIPFSHTFTGAERIFGGLAVPSSESLTAPFAIQNSTSPAKQDKATFRATCGRCNPLQALNTIRRHVKKFTADWTGDVIEGFLFCFRSFLAFTGAKPFSVWVMLQKPVFTRCALPASGACNLYNHIRILYIKCQMVASENLSLLWYRTMVACQNLNRKCRGIEISPNYCSVILQRMFDAFPGIEIRRIE
jgi:hypothetical protein